MADFKSLMTILAAAFGVNVRILSASYDVLPRIKSATNLAFLGAIRVNLSFAFTSISSSA